MTGYGGRQLYRCWCGESVLSPSQLGGTCKAGHYVPIESLIQVQLNGMRLARMSDIRPTAVRWLWRNRIPLGKVTIVDGDPGLGKSMVTLDLVARVTTGAAMPDGTASDLGGPAGAVLLSAEDGLADTIRPRLDAAGADTSRVAALLEIEEPTKGPRTVTLDDVSVLADAIDAFGAKLLVIDPLMAYLPLDVNSYKDQDVRAVLVGLHRLAEEKDVAIVLVRHLTKHGNGGAVHRGNGAMGLIAAARSGLLIAKDPHDPKRRVLAVAKTNVAAEVSSLAYTIGDDGAGVRIRWEGESPLTADDLLDDAAAPVSDPCVAWLKQALAGGERPASQLLEEARAYGFSTKMVRRAREANDVEIRRDGRTGRWLWRLADPAGGQLALLPERDESGDETGQPGEQDALFREKGILLDDEAEIGATSAADQEGAETSEQDALGRASCSAEGKMPCRGHLAQHDGDGRSCDAAQTWPPPAWPRSVPWPPSPERVALPPGEGTVPDEVGDGPGPRASPSPASAGVTDDTTPDRAR